MELCFFIEMFWLTFVATCLLLHVLKSDACRSLQVDSETISNLFTTYHQHSHDAGGRAVYFSKSNSTNRTLYLYHVVLNQQGYPQGRWVIHDKLGSETQAIAYVDSWAVMPHLATSFSSLVAWKIFQKKWISSSNFKITCTSDSDETFYFDSPSYWQLSGFYVQIHPHVFSQIRLHYTKQIYFYKYLNQWIVGVDPKTNVGLGYVVDTAEKPSQINKNKTWNFLLSGTWSANSMTQIISTPSPSSPSSPSVNQSSRTLYDALKEYRSISVPSLPHQSQSHRSMRRLSNGLPIPAIGLGTGGITIHHLPSALNNSYSLGYRLFDLAREYRNEHVVGRLLSDPDFTPSLLNKRNELFLVSKVWPTHLGYNPTILEVIASLNQLKTSYIDLYFLHWPECYSSISWMHCETKVDPSPTGTWRHSYRALERLYHEGHILSIGVSNFNRDLLNQLSSFATVMPHVVQNQGEIYRYDLEVRRWCHEHQVLYMPYATGRNIKNLPYPTLETLGRLGKKYNVSKNALVSQLFLQSGAVIIPRTTNIKHLQENIQLLTWELASKDLLELGWNVTEISLGHQNKRGKEEYEVTPI